MAAWIGDTRAAGSGVNRQYKAGKQNSIKTIQILLKHPKSIQK